jgi:hypothetical protein
MNPEFAKMLNEWSDKVRLFAKMLNEWSDKVRFLAVELYKKEQIDEDDLIRILNSADWLKDFSIPKIEIDETKEMSTDLK